MSLRRLFDLILRKKGFARDFLMSSVGSLLITFVLILMTGIISRNLEPHEFGIYGVGRRAVAFLYPFISLGIPISLVWHISREDSKKKKFAYLASGTVLSLIILAILLTLIFLLRNPIARFVFSSSDRSLSFAVYLLVASLFSVMLLNAWERGNLDFTRYNIFNFLFMALLPLASVSLLCYTRFATSNGKLLARHILVGIAIAQGLSILILAGITVRAFKYISPSELVTASRSILRYGVPRVVAVSLYPAVLLFPPWMSLKLGYKEVAGVISAGLMIFRMADVFSMAFGSVALPYVSRITSREEAGRLRPAIRSLSIYVIVFSVLLTITLIYFMPFVVRIWLGAKYVPYADILRILMVSLPFYFYYSVFRSVIDGLEFRAVNSKNLLESVVFMVLFFAVASFLRVNELLVVILSQNAAFMWLGAKTLQFLHNV